MVWARNDTYSNADGLFVSHGANISGLAVQHGMTLGFDGASGAGKGFQNHVRLDTGQHTIQNEFGQNTTVDNGVWRQYTLTWRVHDNTAIFYNDTTAQKTEVDVSQSPTQLIQNEIFRVGWDDSSSGRYWMGAIGVVRVFVNKALTPSEISDFHTQEVGNY
jgi:hypothetical protein